MPIHLRLMRPSDLPARERIMSTAFSQGLRPLIYPNGQSTKDLIHNYNETLSGLKKQGSGASTSPSDFKDGSLFLVAVDTETEVMSSDFEWPEGFVKTGEGWGDGQEGGVEGRVVAVSVWHLYPQPRTEEALQAAESEGADTTYSPGVNVALMTTFRNALSNNRIKHLSTNPYLYLKILAVDPAFQRRGIGKLLLDWGVKVAEERGVMAYLEATEAGRKLYGEYGWEERGWVEGFDAREFGGREGLRFMCMVRPVGGGGENFKVDEH